MADSISDERIPSLSQLENLFINNPELGQVDAYLKRFNPIKTMGMQHMEIRHSAILGWLLDPQESHGMADQFLKSFLSAALSDGAGCSPKQRGLELSQANLMDAEIRREWQNIDLLIISRANGWIFIIENKFHSKQHGNQLKNYYDKVEKAFCRNKQSKDQEMEVHGIFLILHEEEPQDSRYASILYSDVLPLLKGCVENQVRPLSHEVSIFIQHYIEVIEEATDMDNEKMEMVQLARQLYRDHKKVLDFVVEHGTGNDFSLAVESVFGNDLEDFKEVTISDQQFVYFRTANSIVSFFPKSWYEAFGENQYEWSGCEYWWACLPVICRFVLRQRDEKSGAQLRLHAEVGPLTEHDFRKGLIESLTETAGLNSLTNVSFQRTATVKGKKYSKFLKNNSLEIEDANDSEEIANAMETLLKKFQTVFDELASPMGEFIEHGIRK